MKTLNQILEPFINKPIWYSYLDKGFFINTFDRGMGFSPKEPRGILIEVGDNFIVIQEEKENILIPLSAIKNIKYK